MKHKYTFILAVIVLFSYPLFCSGKERSNERAKFREIIQTQVKRYPQIQIQDYYKLIYQAVFGSAHSGMDSVMAREWLEKEWAETPLKLSGEYADTIRPDGRIIRVDIGAYKAKGGSKEKLLNAFLYTANNYTGSKKELKKYWNYLKGMNKVAGFSKQALSAYLKTMLAKGLPAVHHSSIYERLYKPAYRVILTDALI